MQQNPESHIRETFGVICQIKLVPESELQCKSEATALRAKRKLHRHAADLSHIEAFNHLFQIGVADTKQHYTRTTSHTAHYAGNP